jgi:hypothetical protein
MTKMDQILSTTNAPKFRQQQQNGLNFLSTNTCTKISSTTAKWTECSQQQIAPKFPQQQHQNGQNSLNNKCTKNSSTTAKWTNFSQQ